MTRKTEIKSVAEVAIASTALWLINKLDTDNGKPKHLTEYQSSEVGKLAVLSFGLVILDAITKPKSVERKPETVVNIKIDFPQYLLN